MTPKPPRAHRPRRPGRLGKALLGLVVSTVLLAAVEAGMRLLLGPPPPPVKVYSVVGDLDRYLEQQDGYGYTVYQLEGLAVPPFPVVSDLPRIAVIGGSSVHRGPAEKEFAAKLEGLLGVTTLNLGAPGLDSHDVYAITRELVAFSPSAIVVYTGHNDVGNAFIHHRYEGWTGSTSARLLPLLERSQLFCQLNRLLSAPMGEAFGPGDRLSIEDERQRASTRWDARIEAIVRHYRTNLEGVVRTCKDHGILPVLVTPVSDLITHPVISHCETEPCAIELWRQARQVGPSDPALAGDLLRQARDLDQPPSRATTVMVDLVREVAAEQGALLVDAERDLPQGRIPAPRPDLFDDHIHFSDAGHEAMAAVIAAALEGRPELQVAP